jgi:hypothetical protein
MEKHIFKVVFCFWLIIVISIIASLTSQIIEASQVKVIEVETAEFTTEAETVEPNIYDILESKQDEIQLSIEESIDCIVVENVPYSMEDYAVMVQLLTGECQNQGWDCQVAVGSVALNRVAHEKYPDTLYEVLHQRGQYACIKDGNAYREPTELTLEVADYLLRNGSQLPSTVIYQAQFKQGSGVYTKIGNQIFCYE